MSQVYSVVICNGSFNITLKKEVFDDGYCSSPENEMDKKYEKSKWNSSTVEDPSLEARSRRRARGEKFFPFLSGEASIGAPGQPRPERERPSLKSFFQSQSLSRREEARSTRCRPSNTRSLLHKKAQKEIPGILEARTACRWTKVAPPRPRSRHLTFPRRTCTSLKCKIMSSAQWRAPSGGPCLCTVAR